MLAGFQNPQTIGNQRARAPAFPRISRPRQRNCLDHISRPRQRLCPRKTRQHESATLSAGVVRLLAQYATDSSP